MPFIDQMYDPLCTPKGRVIHCLSTLGFNLQYASSVRVTVGHLTYGARFMVDAPPSDY